MRPCRRRGRCRLVGPAVAEDHPRLPGEEIVHEPQARGLSSRVHVVRARRARRRCGARRARSPPSARPTAGRAIRCASPLCRRRRGRRRRRRRRARRRPTRAGRRRGRSRRRLLDDTLDGGVGLDHQLAVDHHGRAARAEAQAVDRLRARRCGPASCRRARSPAAPPACRGQLASAGRLAGLRLADLQHVGRPVAGCGSPRRRPTRPRTSARLRLKTSATVSTASPSIQPHVLLDGAERGDRPADRLYERGDEGAQIGDRGCALGGDGHRPSISGAISSRGRVHSACSMASSYRLRRRQPWCSGRKMPSGEQRC